MTTMFTKSFVSLYLALVLSGVRFAQVSRRSIKSPETSASARIRLLAGNTRRLELTFKLDRPEYFPGEEAILSIHVRNPTTETLEVYDPLDESVSLTLYKKDSLGQWQLQSSGHELMMAQAKSTVWLAPSQERHLDLHFPCCRKIPTKPGRFDVDNFILLGRFVQSLPDEEGEYRIQQNFTDAPKCEYKIVYPIVKLSRAVKLDGAVEVHYKDLDGVERVPPRTFTRRVAIVVLQYDSQTVVTIGRGVREGGMPELAPGTLLAGPESGRLSPYFRLEETDQQITDVRAVADKDDNLSIQISHAAGQIKKIRLDANRNVLPE